MVLRTRFIVLATASLIVAWQASPAQAHGLRANVAVKQETIEVLAYFDDDSPADEGRVMITDASGREIATGKTDNRGIWTCPRLPAGAYTVVVEALGHRCETPITVDETGNAEFSNWQLDKRVGLAIGMGVLLGLTFVFWYFRGRTKA